MAYTPAGEPSLDAYDQEYAQSPVTEYIPEGAGGNATRSRGMSMADYLDDRAQVDSTTEEGLIAQARAEKARRSALGFSEDEVEAARANISMTRITMDLQGHQSPAEREYEVAQENARRASTRRQESFGGVDSESKTRRKSMSEYLSEAAMTDTVSTLFIHLHKSLPAD